MMERERKRKREKERKRQRERQRKREREREREGEREGSRERLLAHCRGNTTHIFQFYFFERGHIVHPNTSDSHRIVFYA